MDLLRQKRTPLRAAFTRTANGIDEELLKRDSPDAQTLETLLEQAECKGKQLAELDSAILDLLQEEKCTAEQYDKEFESADQYSDRLIDCRCRVRRFLSKLAMLEDDARTTKSSSRDSSAEPRSGGKQRKFRLPEIELRKYGEDVREWLGFWGQFQKIDADPDLALEDKFQYLLQATTPKSKAREIVESFPPTAENYRKAIEHLKDRFGRDNTLVEVYVRDLLRLVMNNTLCPKQQFSLAALYDKLETQLRALETLGVTTDKYAAMLYPLVESCLPEDVIRAWERNRGMLVATPVIDGATDTSEGIRQDRLALLMTFLRNEVEGEERIQMARSGFGLDSEARKQKRKKEMEDHNSEIATAAGLFSGNKDTAKGKEPIACAFCEKGHKSQDCKQARGMSWEQKRQLLCQEKRCFLCLEKGHMSRTCRGKQRCFICQKRHFAVMCSQSQKANAAQSSELSLVERKDSQPVVNNTLANQSCMSEVKLQTLRIFLRGKNTQRAVRVLIDTGSQKSYINTRVAAELGYDALGEERVIHSLFGGTETSEQLHKRYRVCLTSLCGDYCCTIEVLDQAKICGHIPKIREGPWIGELRRQGIVLTDIERERSDSTCDTEIQLLIGADVAGKLLTGRVVPLECGAVAVDTKLGWTLMGRIDRRLSSPEACISVVSLFVKQASIAELWKLDTIGITDPVETQAKEELQEAALQHFLETVTVDQSGRYSVSLPWLDSHPPLCTCRGLAEKRLDSTIRKLKAKNLLEPYQAVLKDWLGSAIIEEVSPDDDTFCHYLPHRAVVKEVGTTKIRPVFDASARERGTPSLNDCLEKGPNLLTLIPDILTQFRLRRIGVVSDIRQAFLQIGIREKDRDYVRFLWHEDGDPEKLKTYRHCRVVFGISSSPFLLNATLAYHLDRVPAEQRKTASILKRAFYVDNCVTSVDTPEDLAHFIGQSRRIMSSAMFDLRGWRYNVAKDLHGVGSYRINYLPEDITGDPALLHQNDHTVQVLGMLWDIKDDSIRCDVRNLKNTDSEPVTKRKILSAAQQIFDPIGFACPVTLFPRLQLQQCWVLKVSWDDPLPEEVAIQFVKWRRQIPRLEELRVPRWIIVERSAGELSLHVFCDASKHAYSACVFLRTEWQGRNSCQLILAKVRVAPLKQITIPRMELLACTIGARLASNVRKEKYFQFLDTYYWTDSANVLHWIRKEEQWGIFVANRVKEIRSLSEPTAWQHVPGAVNPADLPSRGCSVKQLIDSQWWEGPAWLSLPSEQWPRSEVSADEEVISTERKKTVVSAVTFVLEPQWYCKMFSSFPKIVRMIAWLFRFCHNSRTRKTDRSFGELTVKEVEKAEKTLMKLIQNESFQGIGDTNLRSLQPFVDPDGIIRIKTRISTREDTNDFRYPICLPSNHPVVSSLLQWKHRSNGHAGTQMLMSVVREEYWVLRCRRAIRKIVRQCGRCRRFLALRKEVAPAPLPCDRVREASVFEIIGIDLAGPLYLKGSLKCWIVLFTCAIFRAVHLELVTSLTSDAFLQAFRRFVARRGRPRKVYSDNGTNFVGANNLLKKLNWDKIQARAIIDRIEWHFIPPTGAWWGGWWERLIRIVKDILRRVLGKACLTYEELLTVLCETESQVNGRPLTYVSDDARDLVPLTPAMFLQEVRETGVADLDEINRTGLNRRLRHIQKVREDLRKRFRAEYLGQLRQSQQTKASSQIRIGEIVLIGNDHSKRIDWHLAKVVQVFPGKDGIIRVAKLLTSNGEVLRPVQRLFPLEICADKEERIALLKSPSIPGISTEKEKSGAPRSEIPQPVITKSGRLSRPPDRLGCP